MKESRNEIYSLIDEDFILAFDEKHQEFMKDYYYNYYVCLCHKSHRKPLTQTEFFSNMHYRRIQLYQICCPHCGMIRILPIDKRISGTNAPNYCPNCGKPSTIETVQQQLHRLLRIQGINRIGLKAYQADNPTVSEWLLAYDCFQMEITALASIIEVIFRDYFDSLFFMNNFGHKNTYTQKIISKHHGNDFMNIEKSNNIFKKAFGINIKNTLDKESWDDLVDIVNLRNMMIHNNGRVDERFKETTTYSRFKDRVNDKLLRIDSADISRLTKSVLGAVAIITNVYFDEYLLHLNSVIANYYFNCTE